MSAPPAVRNVRPTEQPVDGFDTSPVVGKTTLMSTSQENPEQSEPEMVQIISAIAPGHVGGVSATGKLIFVLATAPEKYRRAGGSMGVRRD
jgi:hypothetical protein